MVRKTKQGGRLVRIETQIAHGSSKRVAREPSRLGFEKPNTSAIERRNGTARTRSSNEAVLVRPWMDATSVRIQRIRPSDRIWSVRELQGRIRWIRSPTYPGGGQR